MMSLNHRGSVLDVYNIFKSVQPFIRISVTYTSMVELNKYKFIANKLLSANILYDLDIESQ